MVITDPHVLDPSLTDNGPAWETMMSGSRKMLDVSAVSFTSLVDTAIALQPDVLLIPGDLTKDGELLSHQFVKAELDRLADAGIPTYVIPGNHDINNAAARSYAGGTESTVANINYADFATLYANYGLSKSLVHDAASLSYVVEPIPGVTLIALDASHDSGQGSLSQATRNWAMAQADLAKEQGNMVMAMLHWQLIEHFDEEGDLVSTSMLSNNTTVAEELMQHGVQLLLTGHFHVSSVSTRYSTNGVDSLVEVSTGSPITFPCPYRMLTFSENRQQVDLTSGYISSLLDTADWYSYSQAWMVEHTYAMLPNMALRFWNKAETVISGNVATSWLLPSIPATDSAKIEIFSRHLGDALVDLYIHHSMGNEPEHVDEQEALDRVHTGIDNMIDEVFNGGFEMIGVRLILKPLVHGQMDGPFGSLVRDETTYNEQTNRTDDLRGSFSFTSSYEPTPTGIGVQNAHADSQVLYDLLGRPMDESVAIPHGVYVRGGKIVIK